MTIANRLANYLSVTRIDYRLVQHKPTQSASDSAHAAHLNTSHVVKSVLLKNQREERYVVALTPASNRLELRWMSQVMATAPVLARESELTEVFPDCMAGAVPGFGQAYNIDIVWDDELASQPCLYFEAGNHEQLIEIEDYEFHQLFDSFPHASISLPNDRHTAYH